MTSFIENVAHWFVTGLLVLTGAWIPAVQQPATPNFGAALPSQTALIDTYLASGITKTDTSMTLADGTTRDGVTLSGRYCFTIDAGSPTLEYVCGTATGTSITGLDRGIKASDPTATSSSLAFAHRRFASIQVTDFPFNQLTQRLLNGTDGFESPLKYDGVSTSSLAADGDYFASVQYVNDAAFDAASVVQASESASGFSEVATQVEAASSTSSGGTGARLVLGANLATSTYNSATAALRVLMTGNDGFLSSSFLPDTITKAFTFSNTLTISGGITYSGSATTFASSSMISYTSSTTPSTTWTKPSNLKYIRVVVVGPGGGAGGSCTACAGGGGGGYGEKIIPAAALGSTETIIVGGGASHISSSFGSFVSCTTGTSGAAESAGSGGTCTGADFSIPGGSGSGGVLGNGGTNNGGRGGDTIMGFGASGPSNTSSSAASGGNTGGNYGGGGSGCAGATDGSPACSAQTSDGGTGVVIVYQYFY